MFNFAIDSKLRGCAGLTNNATHIGAKTRHRPVQTSSEMRTSSPTRPQPIAVTETCDVNRADELQRHRWKVHSARSVSAAISSSVILRSGGEIPVSSIAANVDPTM
jgi:hypothetical protein